jgi:hypothetical protein
LTKEADMPGGVLQSAALELGREVEGPGYALYKGGTEAKVPQAPFVGPPGVAQESALKVAAFSTIFVPWLCWSVVEMNPFARVDPSALQTFAASVVAWAHVPTCFPCKS